MRHVSSSKFGLSISGVAAVIVLATGGLATASGIVSASTSTSSAGHALLAGGVAPQVCIDSLPGGGGGTGVSGGGGGTGAPGGGTGGDSGGPPSTPYPPPTLTSGPGSPHCNVP
jgi:hypothetical protein